MTLHTKITHLTKYISNAYMYLRSKTRTHAYSNTLTIAQNPTLYIFYSNENIVVILFRKIVRFNNWHDREKKTVYNNNK